MKCKENEEFVEVDSKNKPTIPMCWSCADKGGRLRPDCAALGIEGCKILINRWKAGEGCLEDPTFKEEMSATLAESDEPPSFMPASQVMDTHSYGFRITQPVALLTESEYAGLMKALPSAIKLKPMSLPVLGPCQSGNFYPMEMSGLPVDLQNSCRRMELYYDSRSSHDELYLTPASQLVQDQGKRVFQYIAQSAFQKRPEKARPGASPMSYADAKTKHQLQAAQTEAALDAAAAPPEDAGEGSGEDGQTAPNPKRMKMRQFGIVSAQAKPSAKGKAKAKAANAAGPRPTGPSAPEAPTPTTTAPTSGMPATPAAVTSRRRQAVPIQEGQADDASASEATCNSKGAMLLRLDKDLKLVADKHLKNHGNASIKSLEHLQPYKFLTEPSKALSICLTSVGSLVNVS